MKIIQLIVLVVIFCNKLLLCQDNDFLIDVPGFPRKTEIIKISSPENLPIYYCKIDVNIYLGIMTLNDDKIKINWVKGFIESRDSLRLIDYFDNYCFDDTTLVQKQTKTTNPQTFFYYKLRKRWFKQTYKIHKKREILYNWWGDDFQKYTGTLVPLEFQLRILE